MTKRSIFQPKISDEPARFALLLHGSGPAGQKATRVESYSVGECH